MQEFFSRFTERPLSELFPQVIRKREEYYALSEDIKEIVGHLPEKEVVSAGTYLGAMKKGRFVPGTAVLDTLSKISERKVFLEQKQAWLFLCGRDVFADSVRKANVKEGYVLVQSMENENLGYGVYRREGRRMLIRNLFDRGDFLRREKHAHR